MFISDIINFAYLNVHMRSCDNNIMFEILCILVHILKIAYINLLT